MTEPAVLPLGSPSIWSGLTHTFSFHASPESFIAARIPSYHCKYPDLVNSRAPVHAKVLNRDVVVVSSYHHLVQILSHHCNREKLSASQAYDELIAPFFPAPNLVLTDPQGHHASRELWNDRMAKMSPQVRTHIRDAIRKHFSSIPSGSSVDLYDSMKTLAWKVITTAFLANRGEDLHESNFFREVIECQEDLLRGQFSLFPVSIKTRWWTSPRARGLKAKGRLQELLRNRVKKQDSGCPFSTSDDHDVEDVASHLLLFTSSLAAKALASLLTAVILNLYAMDSHKGESKRVVDTIVELETQEAQHELINSAILETERLSPPIVGIMRRATEEIMLTPTETFPQTTRIPRGWDIWLYFVGAARDPVPFGSTAGEFQADRYCQGDMSHPHPRPIAFGAGQKSCLGQAFIHAIITDVVKACVSSDHETSGNTGTPKVELHCGSKEDMPAGIQGWLGWRDDIKPEEWARDVKQLPTQRPSKPIMANITHNL